MMMILTKKQHIVREMGPLINMDFRYNMERKIRKIRGTLATHPLLINFQSLRKRQPKEAHQVHLMESLKLKEMKFPKKMKMMISMRWLNLSKAKILSSSKIILIPSKTMKKY